MKLMWNCSGESIIPSQEEARAPRRPPRRTAVRSSILCAVLGGMLCGTGGVLTAEPQLVAQTAAPVAGLAWTDDDDSFAVGGADGVSICDASSGSVRATLPLPGARALGFAKEAGSGGKLFVALSDGGELSLWNFQAGKALPADIAFTAEPAASGTATSLSADGGASGGLSATGTATAPAGGQFRYTACAFSRNSDYIAAGTEDGSLRIFFKLRFARQFLMKEAGSQTGKITALAFSPDSRLLASASEDGTALLISLPAAAVVARLPFYAPQADRPLAFAPDGTLAVVLDSGSVVFYGTDGMQCGSLIVDGDIEAVSFWAGSETLAVQTTDGTLSLYRVATGDCVASIPSLHASRLRSFAFSGDGASLLAGYENGAVYRLSVADYLPGPAGTPQPTVAVSPEPPALSATPVPAAAPIGPSAAPAAQSVAAAAGPTKTSIEIPAGTPVTIHVGSSAGTEALPSGEAGAGGTDTAAKAGRTPAGKNAAAADAAEAGRAGKKSVWGDFSSVGRDSLSVAAGASFLQAPYGAAFDLEVAYKIGSLLSPFYFGVALAGQIGKCFDEDKFPHSYTWKGEELAPPLTQAVSLYAPAGVQFSLGDSSFLIFTELHAGMRELMLWQTCDEGSLHSDPHFVPLGGLYTGMLFHGFMLQMGVDYDPIQRFTPGVLIGYSFGLPAIGKKGGKQ